MFTSTKEENKICISEQRMDKRTFARICKLARDVGGLKAIRNSSINEIMALFVYYTI